MSEQVSSAAVTGTSLGSNPPHKQKPPLTIAHEKTNWFERLAEAFGEWCSSILIKETRQAVKSRQFLWSYIVLLVAVAAWTAIGLTIPDAERSQILLSGYLMILGFPLGIVIPFAAHRSLAREFEDGTIQLISITTMKPYQIVIGKFGSAMLQMLIYLSVLAPCILFTYMLQGVDLAMLLFALTVCIVGCVCMTILGLFLAGAIRNRALGIGISLVLALVLGFSYLMYCAMASELTYSGLGIDFEDVDAQCGMLASFGFAISTAALLLVASASQISFQSDNRSTPVRIMMVVQQIVFVATCVALISSVGPNNVDEFFPAMAIFAGHYWLIMGFLMMGEQDYLSERVQRSLPVTLFGRTFFSLLMPGPGRGFLFAGANMFALVLIFMAVGIFANFFAVDVGRTRPGRISSFDLEAAASILVSFFFVMFFLSLNFLVSRLFLRNSKDWPVGMGPFASLISGLFLLATLTLVTVVFDLAMFNVIGEEVVFLMGGNWYYVAIRMMTDDFDNGIVSFGLFFLMASIVIVVAILKSNSKLSYRRAMTPERVQEERRQIQRQRRVPEGESIEEIFGELTPKKIDD